VVHRRREPRIVGCDDNARMAAWHRVVLALAASCCAATARAQVIDIAWDAAGRFEHRVDVAPGAFAEACGKLPRGAAVRWAFDAALPLDFNIHYHQGERVVFPARRNATPRARGTLKTTLEQDYCWMWTNRRKQPVALSLKLAR
jgi:hypothetical protein